MRKYLRFSTTYDRKATVSALKPVFLVKDWTGVEGIIIIGN